MSEAKQKTLSTPWFSSRAQLVQDWFAEWFLPSFSMKRRLWPIALGLGYIALIYKLGGLNSDHIAMGLLGFLDAYNQRSRQFLKFFFPFILTGIAFDSMRYFYWEGIEGRVHVAGPYFRDMRWFGITEVIDGVTRTLTPNEFFARHNWVPVDLITGFAYLVFVAEYLTGAFLLLFGSEFVLLKRFGWSFFTVNIMGFITYFIYPAAPPWYVSEYGLGPARTDVRPSAAAAARFDEILGTHFFDQVYGRGIDVYGAYPSLHVAYPLLVAWAMYSSQSLRKFTIPALLFYGLMCFSAVYLQHHYVVDILLGTLYAIVTILILNQVRFRAEEQKPWQKQRSSPVQQDLLAQT